MGNMLPLPVFTFKIQMHLYLLASQMPYFRIANAMLSIERRAGAQLARIKVPSLFVKLLALLCPRCSVLLIKHSAIVS